MTTTTGQTAPTGPTAIIVDCDPGHDDAVALMLAHGSPDIDLLAVTTVAGNQTLAKVTRNALVVATVCGMTGVPIAAGADRPLVRPPRIARSIHGETGLDGPVLPEPTVELDPRHAVDLIIETLMERPSGTVTLVPVAPLTNIALAVRRAPEIVDRVARVVLMGGGFAKGNVTPAAEFNIISDPEAADVVFRAGWPITQVGLDLSHQALATPDVVHRIAGLGTPAAIFVRDILAEFGRNYLRVQGFAAPPVHDPCAVAAVIDPSVVRTRPAHVDIELTGTYTSGMTVTDFLGRDGAELDVDVAVELDVEKFWDLTTGALIRIGDPAEPDVVRRARLLAIEKHAAVTDKVGRPYIEHPARVAAYARELAPGRPDVEAVAWLHDVVEDTEVTGRELEKQFDAGVVAAVLALTRRADEDPDAYYRRVAADPIALLVKEADLADNTDPSRSEQLPPEVRDRLAAKYAHARERLSL